MSEKHKHEPWDGKSPHPEWPDNVRCSGGHCPFSSVTHCRHCGSHIRIVQSPKGRTSRWVVVRKTMLPGPSWVPPKWLEARV